MDLQTVVELLEDRMRQRGVTLEDAAGNLRPLNPALVDEAVELIRKRRRQIIIFKNPPGVRGSSYGVTEEDAKLAAWYDGPVAGDRNWPRMRERLQGGSLREALKSIDEASTTVVAHLANPAINGAKKKGLVLGHVQSGKTANYAAVIAKAVDAGYRLVIVLSGIHNNLRRQTQVRLDHDLGGDWYHLTTPDADFGTRMNGEAILGNQRQTVAVVKKNASRLRRLRDFLADVPETVRDRCPILILDDEADQATPNTKAEKDALSAINQLVREVWGLVSTGSYVGYTATPFANVFMDPDDEQDLFPSDFIVTLPTPDAYFGAERIFGRFDPEDASEPDPGLDMVRSVPDDDAAALAPSRSEREDHDPELPASLVAALRWFVLAAATRRARGDVGAHASMLVHTTHYTHPHFAMQRRVRAWVEQSLADAATEAELAAYEQVWDAEKDRAAEVATKPLPSWQEVSGWIPRVLEELRVLVDNGYSEERLDYSETDDDGRPVPQTVIAIGGGTLSRGLTLEGLIVSYFTRTSRTYDTLLQMGRWFGYRPGYEDLPRLWMTEGLSDDFEFLAQVEHEFRTEIRTIMGLHLTPEQMGVRVRAHPGRLSITARNKMVHASKVRIGYSGQTIQTILFDETDPVPQLHNLATVRALVSSVGGPSTWTSPTPGTWVAHGVPVELVKEFLAGYDHLGSQTNWQPQYMNGWIDSAASDRPWNVAVLGLSKGDGTVDLGLAEPLVPVVRAPLAQPRDYANIKALMSMKDRIIDLPLAGVAKRRLTEEDARRLRHEHADGRGLLVVYPIDPKSEPKSSGARRSMNAPQPLIGVGVVFPQVDDWEVTDPRAYYSVRPDWSYEVGEAVDFDGYDTEGNQDDDDGGTA